MGKSKAKPTTIRFEREKLMDVNELKLDVKNNRITHLKVEPQKLEDILWKEGKLQSLYNDILNRGMQEPLILYPKTSIVAEGNCRLVCVKKIHREAIESDDPKLERFKKYSVPCKRMLSDTSPSDIDAFLTEIHVGRKKRWPEYNQAKLLYKLKNKDNLPIEEIASIARSSRPIVTRKINCYMFMKQYIEMFPEDHDYVGNFYIFWEFQKPELKE